MNTHDREAILYAFAIEPNHDRQTIERYLRQYPEFAEDLIDILSERRLSEVAGVEGGEAIADPHCDEAWRELLRHTPRIAPPQPRGNPFARFPGQSFAKLAEALNIPRSVLTALRDGLVKAQSIPDRFLERLANAMESSVDSIRSYFDNPEVSLLGRAFKSDSKPVHQGQVTFQELVQGTNMSDEQRKRLLEDSEDDGLDRSEPSEG